LGRGRGLIGDELRFIRRYLATRTDRLPWLFLSEREQPLSRKTVYYLVSTAAQSAGLQNVHPHTLRHSCGYHLADKGTDLRARCSTISATAIRVTPCTTRVSPAGDLKGCGAKPVGGHAGSMIPVPVDTLGSCRTI
jgi:site-specific recombinase XerD